jgi:glycosyltransferase involved in cell wall biosynthesis
LDFWPQILAAEPTAELHVAYGWETIDRMIERGRIDLVPFREKMVAMIEKADRVVWRGRLGQADLAQLYAESYAWLYPCDFLEVSCISAMEAMAGGAVPVVTRAGALPETIGDAGLLVPGPSQSRAFGDLWPRVAIGVLMEANTRFTYAARGRKRAKSLTWDVAFGKWEQIIELTKGEPAHAITHQVGGRG